MQCVRFGVVSSILLQIGGIQRSRGSRLRLFLPVILIVAKNAASQQFCQILLPTPSLHPPSLAHASLLI